MQAVPSLRAVVVTYNSAAVLPACLAALARDGIDTIIVDNASTDTTRDVARQHGAVVIANAANEGFGRANNIGVAAADGADLCLILNPDVVVDPGLRDALLAAASRYPEAIIFGPRLIEPDGRHFFRGSSVLLPNMRETRLAPTEDGEAVNLSGACMLVRRGPFQALGGFDPNIFLFYEDDDLCHRVRQAGGTLRYVHGAVARHARGGSSPDHPAKTYLVRWHQAWSRIYVCRKHGVKSDAASVIAVNAGKYLAAALSGNVERRMRYAGSVAGSIAALRRLGAAFPRAPEPH